MIIFNLNTYPVNRRSWDIIIESNNIEYGIEFDNSYSREQELLEHIISIITPPEVYTEYMTLCIEIARQIKILDKVKTVLLFTKYSSLIW